VYDVAITFRTHATSAFFKQLQHWRILRQDLRDKLLDPRVSGDCREMAHQGRADTLPLVLVDHGERHFGHSGLHQDIASTADNHGRFPFVNNRDQAT
jgi:hypothetical protein